MKSIPKYSFHKTKYGEELLIDIVRLKDIRKYIQKDPVHILTYFDITFITEGTATFSIDNKQYSLNYGDVIFSRPGEVRAWGIESVADGNALIFEEEFLLSFFNDSLFIQNLTYFRTERRTPVINIKDIQERINYLIQNITTEINHYQQKDKHILRALLYEILMLLDREYRKTSLENNTNIITKRHVTLFTEIVNKNFRKHHDTGYYADKLCITPNYLNEIVKKTTGINAKLYIQNKLLSEAKKMLTYTSLPISEIAESLSFDSSTYFIRIFRKQTGITPLQYRLNTKR